MNRGVLLITTKRGDIGKPKVSLSSSVSMTSFPFLRENMNSYEYTSSFNKALAYDSYVTGGYNPKFSDEDIELYRTGADPIFHPSIDWYDEINGSALFGDIKSNASGADVPKPYFANRELSWQATSGHIMNQLLPYRIHQDYY